jgi:hypothetical protein
MKKEYGTTEKEKANHILTDEVEISPINPKVLKFTETGEVEFPNNSVNFDLKSEKSKYTEYSIKSPLSSKSESLKDTSSIAESIGAPSMTSYYSVSKAPNVSCKRHGQVFIGVDTKKFRLTCKKCQDLGVKVELDFSERDNLSEIINVPKSPEDEVFCNSHSEEKGNFYCDDCKVFICKSCFSNDHRKHNSNLLTYISTLFKNNLKDISDEVQKLQPRIENSLEEMSEKNKKIKKIRDETLKIVKETVNKINSVCKIKFDNLSKESLKIFLGLDIEVENLNNRSLGLQKKVIKYINELNEFSNYINKIENQDDNNLELENSPLQRGLEICEYRKSKASLFNEIKKILDESNNLLNYKTPNIKAEVKSKLEYFSKEIQSFNKNLKIFQNSVMTSISMGIKNYSILLRRFPKFQRKGFKYYKTSSLIIKVDQPVFLAGLGLCGLYVSSMKVADSHSEVYQDMSSRGRVELEIKISEIKQEESETQKTAENKNEKVLECKFRENHSLFGVINRNDPTYMIYFKKAVYLKPNIKYLLSVNNLDTNPIIDIWCGEVNKSALTNLQQKIKCNVSNLSFSFESAEGFESDFNEFNLGVIANLIYLTVD